VPILAILVICKLIFSKYLLTKGGDLVIYFRIFLKEPYMLKIVSAMLLAAMFIGCSESATTEAPATEEAAAPAEEVAAPAEEAAATTEEAAATEAAATEAPAEEAAATEAK